MEKQKSELVSNNAKRQKVDINDENSQNFSDTFISLEAMELDKLERDRTHLTDLNLFVPELVWKSVFKRINRKDDIENLSNSTPYFRTLLAQQSEAEVVLPNVFAILTHHFTLDEFFKDINLDGSFPSKSSDQVTFSLPKNDIMNCRLVCKSWNNAIEEIHTNKDAGHYIMKRDFKSSKNYFPFMLQGFHDDSRIREFINHFKATHFDLVDAKSKKSPFLWRYVIMPACVDEDNVEAQFTAMTELITKWGEEVWYFGFEARSFEDYVETVEPYKMLHKLCQLMPNLRILDITFDREEHFSFESPEERQDLIEEISTNPFPKLAKLEYLCTVGVPISIFNHLIDQHPDTTQLNVERPESIDDYAIIPKGLPNLTQLCLEIRSPEDFEMFERSNIHLKLAKMQFIYHDFEDLQFFSGTDADHSLPFVSWLRVLAALENKIDSNSCTELYLKLPTPSNDAERKSALQDSLHCRLKFPNVKLISIWQATVLSLDFLLPLKNSLCGIKLIRGRNYFDDSLSFRKNRVRDNHFREMQVIKFIGFEPNLQDSNISSVLTRLKTVVVSAEERYVRYFFELDGVKRKWYSPWFNFRGDLEQNFDDQC